jgi:hypothetical protein
VRDQTRPQAATPDAAVRCEQVSLVSSDEGKCRDHPIVAPTGGGPRATQKTKT